MSNETESTRQQKVAQMCIRDRITMERMQEKIRRDEQARLREIAKKRAEQEKNGRQSSAAGGNRNNSNNYNGYGNTGGLGGTGGMIRR